MGILNRYRLGLAGLLVVAGALALGAGVAAAAGGPANWTYEPTSFSEVRLSVPAATEKTLEEGNPKDKYLEAEFSFAETDGTPETAGPFSAPITVGIKIKGHAGSGRKFSEKAAFKISFGKFVEGQTFMGLEKVTLNNMIQDPSMIHEATAYEAFHAMGVPAPHVGYTYLTINGESYGLHLNIETQDVQSLETAFGTTFMAPPQHLYEGEYGADVSEQILSGSKKKWEALEVSEGEDEEADLEAFVKAVEAPGAFATRIAKYAQLEEMTRSWMTEKYIGHWDSYAGSSGPSSPNNYYLYSDASGQFQILPSGADQTWQPNQHLSFSGPGGVLFNDCLGDETGCAATYRGAGSKALSVLTAQRLGAFARCTDAAVEPWRKYEREVSDEKRLPNTAVGQPPYSEASEANEVANTYDFIEKRPAELAAFLGASVPPPSGETPACPPLRKIPPPEPPSEPGPPPGGPSPPLTPAPSGGSSATVPVPVAAAPSTSLVLGRVLRAERYLTVRASVPGAGRVTVQGHLGKDERVCRGVGSASAAGTLTVRCRFTKAFRESLGEGSRRISLTARFADANGAEADASRRVRLARQD